jgi:hypothetical protein
MSRMNPRRGSLLASLPGTLLVPLFFCLAAGCSLPWPAPPPIPVQVNGFDAYPDDSPVLSGWKISKQFQKQGVIFQNAQAVKSALFTDLGAESSPNVLVTLGESPRLGTVKVRFVRPSDGVSPAETNQVGAVFIDVDDPSENARLEAYNRAGQLLQAAQIPVGANGSRRYVEIKAEGIAYALLVLGEGGDGCAVDDFTYGVVPIEVFVIEGYPAYGQERKFIETYMHGHIAGKEGDVFYVSNPGKKRFLKVQIGDSPEELARALQTAGACVGFTGHSNYSLGVMFSELPDKSQVEWVTSISDFWNDSTELANIDWPHLVEKQAYPNLWIQDDEIAIHPQNYCTPVGLQRFPNDEGVGVCEEFGDVQGEGMERWHYHLSGLTGQTPRLIVRAGHADLPSPLRYAVYYYRSCNSGNYYSENFQRGVLFHTTADSLITEQDLFIDGILRDLSWESLKSQLNHRQNNNDYYDFTQWPAHERCDPECE